MTEKGGHGHTTSSPTHFSNVLTLNPRLNPKLRTLCTWRGGGNKGTKPLI
jgi:hypothetical protein